MSTQYEYNISGDERVIDIIFDDVNNLKTCHLCCKEKTYKIVSFALSKLNHVDRTRKDYALFVGLGIFSLASLLARGRGTKILTRAPGEFHYDFVPLHLCLCKDCFEKRINFFGKLKLNKFDYMKHPLYHVTKELGYKKLLCLNRINLENLDDNPTSLKNNVLSELKKMKIFPSIKNNQINYHSANNITLNSVEQSEHKKFDKYGLDDQGYNREGFNIYGYNREGFRRDGFNDEGYDKDGYKRDGFNDEGYDRFGFDIEGYNLGGFDRDGYDRDGYSFKGYDCDGYDRRGFDKNGIHINTGTKYDNNGWSKCGINVDTGTLYNKLGFDMDGYDKDGYNKGGFDRKGFNKKGFNKEGFDYEGYNKDGFNIEGYNRDGYDSMGFNKLGYNKNGYDNDGYDKDGYNEKGFNKDYKFRNGKTYVIGKLGYYINLVSALIFIVFCIVCFLASDSDFKKTAELVCNFSRLLFRVGYFMERGSFLKIRK